jgi:DNA repair protein RAD16
MSNTTRRFDTYVANGVMLRNYANIFGLIMQMRQGNSHSCSGSMVDDS